MVDGKQGHAPCEILSLQLILFLCQLNFMDIIRLSSVDVNFASLRFFGIFMDLNSGVCMAVISVSQS